MSSFRCHFLLLCVSIAIDSNPISVPSNAVQITKNTFVDDVGVLVILEANLNQSHRRLVDDSSCSTPPYNSSCTSTNPSCPCTALTSSEKQSILDAHNTRRSLAASGSETCADSSGQSTAQCPSASNMNYLFWDDGLSVVATYWAHQCIWGDHQDVIEQNTNSMYKVQCDSSSCLSRGYIDGWIGENLAATSSSRPDWSIDHALNGIKSWFDESKYYDFDERTSYGVTGHWTQGVWAATRYIGCGYAACSSGSPFSITEWFNFVCKYYPGGNYPTQPYTKGETCNECSDDRNLCADGLCGGGQCSSCAVDFGQNRCNYNASWCPSEMLCDDGVGRTVNCGSDLWDQQSEQLFVSTKTLRPTMMFTSQHVSSTYSGGSMLPIILAGIIASFCVCCCCVGIIWNMVKNRDLTPYKMNMHRNTLNIKESDKQNVVIENEREEGETKGVRLVDILNETPNPERINKRAHNNMLEVQSWLENEVNLPEYFDVFIKNGYESMQIIKEISDLEELSAIGIDSKQVQWKIMEEIKKWEYAHEENRKREGSQWNDQLKSEYGKHDTLVTKDNSDRQYDVTPSVDTEK